MSEATVPTPARPLDAATREDLGKLLLRLTIGVLLLFHGCAKIAGGVGPVVGLLGQHQLPAVLAYGVYVGEVLAPLLLIAGLWTRAAALLAATNMVVAIALAHSSQFFTLGKEGGWALELQGLYLLGALSVALLGAGRFSVARVGRWN